MRQLKLHAPGDIRIEEAPKPELQTPTDAIIRLQAACICGSDLWPYRGVETLHEPTSMGHEYVGIIEEIGSEVHNLQPGQLVVGSFIISDYSAPNERFMTPARLDGIGFMNTTQAEYARIPHADGMLVPVDFDPTPEQLKSLLAASDVFGTAWYGARAAAVEPGKIVAVVGDGAVGLSTVLAAKLQGAETIIAMSRHADRQQLAREFGATHIVEERGEAGAAAVRELTDGLGAHSVIEAVGLEQSFHQGLAATRPGGHMSFVGVPHGVSISAEELFFLGIHLTGGPAPVRRYLPELIELIRTGKANPGRVFTDTLPLSQAAKGYQLMDERKSIKVMIDPTR